MNINLHIDQLILDGVNIPQSQRHLLRASVEAELGRLFRNGGMSPSLATGGAMAHVSASNVHLSNRSDPAQLGRQIALSVYGGIGK